MQASTTTFGCQMATRHNHKDPPEQGEFIGALKRAKLAHPFK